MQSLNRVHFGNEIILGFGSKYNNAEIGIGLTSELLHYA